MPEESKTEMTQKVDASELKKAATLLKSSPTWHEKLFNVLVAIGTLVAGLGTLPVDSANLPLPPEWRPYLLAIGLFSVSARFWLGTILDLMDNWKLDGSFKWPDASKASLWILVITVAVFSCSCAAIGSAVTGTPIPATPMRRVDGTGVPIQIATQDVAVAEASDPKIVHGLYKASTLAEQARTTVVEAVK